MASVVHLVGHPPMSQRIASLARAQAWVAGSTFSRGMQEATDPMFHSHMAYVFFSLPLKSQYKIFSSQVRNDKATIQLVSSDWKKKLGDGWVQGGQWNLNPGTSNLWV